MADESIGQVSVNIVGDYSALEKSFTEAQNLAQQAGASISAGLEAGAAGANDLTAAAELTDEGIQQLFADGMKAAEAWSAFGITAEQAAAATAALGGQAQAAATGFTAVANAAGGAIPPVQGAGAAIASAGNNAEAAGVQVDGLISKMYALMALRAFVRIGEDAIEAYGKIQQLTVSMDLLGAGAKGAVAEVQMLKDLSIQLAVPFEDIAESARKLSASFGTGENMTAVLIAAGNAAQATGQSFQTITAALERVNDTGAITGRQLLALHISWQQMAESMGVSIDEAKAKLKAGGQSAQQDVSDLIDAIQSKYAAAAEAQSQTLLGQITILKNEVAFALAQIGEDLGPVIPLIGKSVLVLISGFEVIIFDLKIVIDRVVQFGMTAVSVLQTVGKVAGDIAKGNALMAAADVANGILAVKDISAHASAEMLADATKLSSSLAAIWGENAKKISATFTPSGGGGDDAALKATRDKVKGFTDQASSLQLLIDMERDEIAQQKKVTQETAAFNEAVGAMVSQSDFLAIKLAIASENMRGLGDEYIPKTLDKITALEKETNKLSKTMGMLGDEVNAAGQQALNTTPWGQMDAALKTLGLSEDDLTTKSRMAKVAAAEFIAANSNDIPKVTAAWETINSEISRLSKVNLPAAIAMENELIDSMKRTGAPIGQIIALEEQQLQKEIQLRTENRLSSNEQIIALDRMKTGEIALQNVNNVLGNTYVALRKDIEATFDRLGGEIAQGIMEGKNFTAVWKGFLHELETQILTTLISAIVKYGVSWVEVNILQMASEKSKNAAEIAGITTVSSARAAATTAQLAQITAVAAAQTAATATFVSEQLAAFLTVKLAATALDVSEVLGDAAVGGAAAAASTAAIPIIGPALALEAGAAMYASIAGIYTPLATFSEGGMVPEDMLALVHKGEYVLSAEKTAAATVGGGAGGGETHVHFDFSGAHFSNGMNDNQVKAVFDRAFRMSKLAGALPAGRFPQ